ncbi:hypothetical protein D3C77_578920 [compost metagenome]
MMSCPDRDARCIKHRGYVMRMNIIQIERNQSDFPFPRSINRHTLDFRQPFNRVGGKLRFMAVNFIQPDLLEEINSCSQPNRSGNDRRAALEFIGKLLPGRFV